MLVGFDVLHVISDVAALGGHDRQREPCGVGAVGLDHFDRIDAIPERLAHLPPLFISHQLVDIDIFERDFIHKLQPHHDHTGNPKEDDIKGGAQQRSRVKGFEIGGSVWPTQGGERPKAGREPGVEDIGILNQMRGTAFLALLRLFFCHVQMATILTVPDGNAMSPP